MSETTIAILNQYPPDKFNVLAPTTFSELSPLHSITVSQVDVNPIIPRGETSNGQVYTVSGGKLAPHKETVLRLADAAGLKFRPTILKQHDDGSFEASSIAEKQDPDGTWRQFCGTSFWNVPERIAQATGGDKEVRMIRKFAAERAESGAMARAVKAAIGMKSAYTAAELSRPFIVARMTFNPWRDPEIARMYRVAMAARLAANLDALRGPDDGGDPFGIEAPEQVRRITTGQAAAATDMLETMGAIPASGNGENGGPIWGDDVVQAGEESLPALPEPEPQHAAMLEPKRKLAIVKTPRWADALKSLATNVPYYSQNGRPDAAHALGAALKLGYPEITDANLDIVLDALSQYAIDRANAAQAERDGIEQAELL